MSKKELIQIRVSEDEKLKIKTIARKKLDFLTPLEYFFANFAIITNGLTDKLHL